MARATNKMYEPFRIFPPGTCPNCHNLSMGHILTERTFFRVDDDGIDHLVSDPNQTFMQDTFVCIACGFTTDEYIETDRGWRWNPNDDAEYIRAQNINPAIHKHRQPDTKNPFIKEES